MEPVPLTPEMVKAQDMWYCNWDVTGMILGTSGMHFFGGTNWDDPDFFWAMSDIVILTHPDTS